MNAQSMTQKADYFGLMVEVVQVLKNCSLIRFEGQDSIVDTIDLVITQDIKRAA
jgi:hypothetical protein